MREIEFVSILNKLGHERLRVNLKSASKYAEQDLRDRWEWYKEHFIRKMRKQ